MERHRLWQVGHIRLVAVVDNRLAVAADSRLVAVVDNYLAGSHSEAAGMRSEVAVGNCLAALAVAEYMALFGTHATK